MPGGFIGVDIFFVISGFLISSIIFKGLQHESFTFTRFYANRIKRIFPALLLVLVGCAVFGWFFLLPGEYAQLGKHIFGGAGYIENFLLRQEAGYFDTKSYLKPLMHLWSLGIEEQFYLTYPLLLWATWRLRWNFLAVLAPLILISFSLNLWEVGRSAASSFFLPQMRFWELWAGGALAYVDIFRPDVREHLYGNGVLRNISSAAGTLLIAAGLLLVRQHAFPGWWALLPVIGASLLILAGPEAWINRVILSNRIAVFVGLISYPLYLWHWPILSFARMIRGDEVPAGARIAAVILAVVLAWATWRFVESPIRFGRTPASSSDWIKTTVLLLASGVILCVGYSIHAEDGFAGRFKNVPGDFGWAQSETFFTPACGETVGAKLGYCRSSEAGAPDVLLIGDSHAGALYRGLAPAYAQRSQVVMNLGEAGCAPFFDTESYTLGEREERDCKSSVNRMLAFAVSGASVHTVILAAEWPLYMTGREFGDDPGIPEIVSWEGAPKNSSQAKGFAAALRNTVAQLTAAGKNVIVFVDWPELGFDAKSCLPRPVPLFSHPRALCGVPRSQVDARDRDYRATIFDLKKTFASLKVFDPLPYLCDREACYAMRNGHLLYRDDNHLSAAGAKYLAEKFMAEQFPPQPSVSDNP
jgi:peptidoglycan/LPS O-acetylase OafA/YrhL